jgi:hypothetical protein
MKGQHKGVRVLDDADAPKNVTVIGGAIKVTKEADGSITFEVREHPKRKVGTQSGPPTGTCDTGVFQGVFYCVPTPGNPCSGSCDGPFQDPVTGFYYCDCD